MKKPDIKRIIKNRIVFSVFIALSSFLVLVGIYLFYISRAARLELFSSMERDSVYIETRIEEIVSSNVKTAQNTGYNSSLQKVLFSDYVSDKMANLEASRELLASARDKSTYISDLFYYSESSHLYTISEYYSAFRENMERYGFDKEITFSDTFFSEYPLIDANAVFFFVYTPIYRTAQGIAHRNETHGLCAVLCDLRTVISDISDVLSDKYGVYLLYDGMAVSEYNSVPEIEGVNLMALTPGQNKYRYDSFSFFSYVNEKGPWRVVCIEPVNRIKFGELYSGATIAFFFILSVLIFMALLLSFRKQEAQKHEMEVQKELLSATIAQQEAEMSAYRSQINPHFFFNTLECVRSMAQYYGADMIEEIITAMSKMFRFSLYSEMTVDFEQELDILEQYFLITSYRFPDKYELVTDIDSAAASFRVPSMILQPLVENSIKHGFKTMKKDGKNIITVSASLNDEGLLEISVRDNGVGMDKETLDELVRKTKDGDASIANAKDSIGLKNIYERIKLFNNENDMEFSSVQGEFTQIKLTLHYAELKR